MQQSDWRGFWKIHIWGIFQNSVRGKIGHKVGGGYDIGGLPEGDIVSGDSRDGEVQRGVSPGSE